MCIIRKNLTPFFVCWQLLSLTPLPFLLHIWVSRQDLSPDFPPLVMMGGPNHQAHDHAEEPSPWTTTKNLSSLLSLIFQAISGACLVSNPDVPRKPHDVSMKSFLVYVWDYRSQSPNQTWQICLCRVATLFTQRLYIKCL